VNSYEMQMSQTPDASISTLDKDHHHSPHFLFQSRAKDPVIQLLPLLIRAYTTEPSAMPPRILNMHAFPWGKGTNVKDRSRVRHPHFDIDG